MNHITDTTAEVHTGLIQILSPDAGNSTCENCQTCISPTSNREFLTAIFGDTSELRPFVIGFHGNPKTREGGWSGYRLTPNALTDDASRNWYFTLATFPEGARRKGAECGAVVGVMFDDIGTKAPPIEHFAPCPPSIVIETSPGNCQIIYLFTEPQTDLKAVTALNQAAVEAGLCDKDAKSPTTRWGRLPFAVNGKSDPATPCRLVEWHPERRYTIEQIMDGLELATPVPVPARHAPAQAMHSLPASHGTDLPDDAVADTRNALSCISSDDYATWIEVGRHLVKHGSMGQLLWLEWSARSHKWKAGDAAKWETFTEPSEAGYKAVLTMAQECGWTNPAKGKRTRKTTAVEDFAGEAQDITGPFPDMDGRPCYVVLNDWREHAGRRYMPGVYYCGIKDARGDNPPTMFDAWFCSPLHIDAVTFDATENNYGRLLRFKPTEGNKWREWAMPMELLAGDCSQLRGELLSMGVLIDHNKRTYLPTYLQSEHPKRRMHCALQVGWFGDSFVLPDVVIGPSAKSVIFQSGERGHEEHTRAGTLEGWKSGIAAKAMGNQLLTLAVSASFAGPMLQRCNAEGGGVHIVGDSSTGKSTLMEAACATWGGPGFKRSWRATANGMEGAAAMFNDCLLALDEISECDPKEVGAIVYALGNGRGKQRASRSGAARSVTQWRCFVMSNGERSIATTMTEGGYRIKAGQSMRLLDIPAAETHGAWNDVHGATSPSAFSDALKRTAAQHHGHAGRAFLERLTHDHADYCAELDKIKSLPMFMTNGTEGQDKRAAARFALIGMAGEVATAYGITGWEPMDAIHAAAYAFKLWQRGRGKGNDERRQITDKLRGFIERHLDSRFSNADFNGDTPSVRDRAGYWRNTAEGKEYLFTAEGMREALKGFDFSRALDVLQEVGALPVPGADGKRAKFHRIFGMGMKLYPVNPEKLEGDDFGA